MVSTENSSFCKNSFGKTICATKTASARERPVSSLSCALSPMFLIFIVILLRWYFCVCRILACSWFFVPNLPHFVNSSILLPYSGFQFLFFLGRVPNKPSDFANLFRTCQHVSFLDPLVSSPSPSSAPPRDSPGTVFVPGKEVFAHPGSTAPSQPPQTRYPFHQQAPPKRLDIWPLLLPGEARAWGDSCGELSTPLETVKPVRGTLVNLHSACI